MSALPGVVYLIGAGPGDPGLFTCRGAELLKTADVVIYDRLGTEALMVLANPQAKRIYVGKQPGKKAASQEEIHQFLLEEARLGLRVVRLKGGDPFVFGRGGEEALALKEAGIPFEVVPGVTAGIAAPAYAGIPVTHRAVAVGLSIFTGHEDPLKAESQLNLASLSKPGTTGVFYMGRKNLPKLAQRIIDLGRAEETPVALIEWGTYPRQRTVTGTLGTITQVAEEASIVPPCITIVGEVVALREKLAWFEDRPLAGKTVAVTRARVQASGLVKDLRSRGARVLEAPTVRIEGPADPAPLEKAVSEISSFQWIVLASPNAVGHCFAAMKRAGKDSRSLAGVRVAVAGPATAKALAEHGITADLIPKTYGAAGLLQALPQKIEAKDRVFLPRSAIGKDELLEGLQGLAQEVVAVEAYQTVLDTPPEEIRRCFENGEVDAVTFTSSSTVENFHRTFGHLDHSDLKVACIGPSTHETALELGYEPDWMAKEATLDSLVECLVEGMRTGTR